MSENVEGESMGVWRAIAIATGGSLFGVCMFCVGVAIAIEMGNPLLGLFVALFGFFLIATFMPPYVGE